MKSLLTLLIPITLTACSADMMQRARLEKEGNPQDVAYCKFEASKVQGQGYGAIEQAVDTLDRQSQVFNACMAYRSASR